MRKFLFLNSAQRFSDFALLLMRLFVGLFLIWGVWDNITDAARMQEFAAFLAQARISEPQDPRARLGLPAARHRPGVRARPVHALGRHLLRHHFVVAIAMVDRFDGMRGIFPSGCLVVIGLYLATHGAGRFSVDAVLKANELPRASGGVRFKT